MPRDLDFVAEQFEFEGALLTVALRLSFHCEGDRGERPVIADLRAEVIGAHGEDKCGWCNRARCYPPCCSQSKIPERLQAAIDAALEPPSLLYEAILDYIETCVCEGAEPDFCVEDE